MLKKCLVFYTLNLIPSERSNEDAKSVIEAIGQISKKCQSITNFRLDESEKCIPGKY